MDGVPSVKDGGNVLRPFSTAKLSLRLPPPVEPDTAADELVRVLSADPPQGAKVTVEVSSSSPGFVAPVQSEWLASATERASKSFFGRSAAAMSEGGTIPFLAELASRFPAAQIPRHRRARPLEQRPRAERDARPGDGPAPHGCCRAGARLRSLNRRALRLFSLDLG